MGKKSAASVYDRNQLLWILFWSSIICMSLYYFANEALSQWGGERKATTEATPTQNADKPKAVEESKEKEKEKEREKEEIKEKRSEPEKPSTTRKGGRRTSSYLCSMFHDYLQVCEYQLMCFDGKFVILLDDKISTPVPFPHKDPQLESVNWEPNPAPPAEPSDALPLPHEYKGTGYFLPSSMVDWNYDPSKKAEGSTNGKYKLNFLDGSMWLIRPETPHTDHTWHTLISLMPLWTLQFLNKTRLPGDRMYPSIDNLILQESNDKKQPINYFMLTMILQPHTKIRFFQDISIEGKPLADPLPREKYDRWHINRGSHIDLPKNHLVCARQAVVPAYKYTIFSGPAEAYAFREKAYSVFNLPFPTGQDLPPFTVLILDRVGSARAFNNPMEIIRIVERLNLPYRYVHNPAELSVEEQVKAFYGAGLTIHAHGGSETNIIFQQPKSAVIEVFTYHHHQHAFAQLAMMCRLLHFPVYTYVKGPSVRFKSVDMEMKCKNYTIYAMGRDTDCLWPTLYSFIDFPSRIMEVTIVSAMRSIGYPILPTKPTLDWMTANSKMEGTKIEGSQ